MPGRIGRGGRDRKVRIGEEQGPGRRGCRRRSEDSLEAVAFSFVAGAS